MESSFRVEITWGGKKMEVDLPASPRSITSSENDRQMLFDVTGDAGNLKFKK